MRKNLFAFTLYLGIGLARVAQSIDKLPADPGFDRVREIRVEGLTGLLNRSLGYLDISARIGPLLTTLLSLRYTAIVLSLFTVFVTAMLALLIFVVIAEQTKKSGMAILCGAILMLVPAASESTIGNHGSIKWPLITALAVVASSQIFVENYKVTSIALALFVGLSNPFAIFALTGFVSDFLKTKRLNWKSHGVLIVPLLLTTLT